MGARSIVNAGLLAWPPSGRGGEEDHGHRLPVLSFSAKRAALMAA
jgi:hypothetical protein